MNARFRFRHVNELTGTLVLLVLVLVIAAVVLTGRSQRWFAPTYTLQVVLPEEGSFGLGRGSEVFILGIPVGTVQEVSVEDTGRLVARVRIRQDFRRFLRADSTVTIKKVFGVAGDAYLEIARGSGAALPDRGAVITSRAEVELAGMMERTLEELRQEVLGVAVQVRETLEEWRQVATALGRTQDRLRTEDIAPLAARAGRTLDAWARLGTELTTTQASIATLVARLDALVTGLEQGRGTAGRLLTDTSLADASQALIGTGQALVGEGRTLIGDGRALIGDGRASLQTLDEVLENVRQVTERLATTTTAVTAGASEVPALVLQARQTLAEVERLVTGLQRHWLVRDYIDAPGSGSRLPPGTVSGAGP